MIYFTDNGMWVVCANCSRGVKANKNGKLPRHYNVNRKTVCIMSGKLWADNKKKL